VDFFWYGSTPTSRQTGRATQTTAYSLIVHDGMESVTSGPCTGSSV
jgi:hypothetical protein